MSKLLSSSLLRKANKISDQLLDLRHTKAFQQQDFETQTDLYNAINTLKVFIDNIK
jgi:hypothetical protein